MNFIRVIFLPMKRYAIVTLFIIVNITGYTQSVLTLDSCRRLAISNNPTIKICKEKREGARYERKVAFSNYLPKISAAGTYIHNQKRASLLSEEKRDIIGGLGNSLQESSSTILSEIAILFPELKDIIALIGNIDLSAPINNLTNIINDAFTIDTRNIYIAALSLEQPLFTGGKIIAYNRMARHAEKLTEYEEITAIQDITLATEKAYWQIVSISNKRRLAESMVTLVEKLHSDITELKEAGMATNADILSVDVKLNEAKLALLRATDGEKLARMLLSEICGLPVDSAPTLADESLDNIPSVTKESDTYMFNIENRSEVKSLQSAIEIYRQKKRIVLADYLPQAILTANYFASSPNITDGFSKKFKGMWNVGVVLKIPLWNWGEGYHKVKAAECETRIAEYTLENVKRKIELQVKQAVQQSEESYKRLLLARSSIHQAEENLRSVNISLEEGLATSSNVLEAQTSWLLAHSAMIDAQIDVMLSEAYLKRTLGTLKY